MLVEKVFLEGLNQDIKEYGLAATERLYSRMSRQEGKLGEAVQASLKISRMLDADRVAGR